jgi:predicted choloylglycine hydrolase
MRKYILKGSYFEIGKQLGKHYEKTGLTVDHVKINKTIYKNQRKIYEKYYPNFLKELKGMSIGGNFDLQKLEYYFIASGYESYKNKLSKKESCSIVGYKFKNNLFVGRNYDWVPIDETVFQVYSRQSKDCLNYIGISDMNILDKKDIIYHHLLYNVIDAINSKGLYIGITFGYNFNYKYGLDWSHFVKLISETCSSVKEALKLIKKIPLSTPKNFFIADKFGDVVVVEHVAKTYKLIYPQDNLLIHTNHYLDASLKKKELVLKKAPTNSTYVRYYEILQKINQYKNNFSQKDITKIMDNNKLEVLQKEKTRQTIWTLSLDMTKKKYFIYTNLFGKKKKSLLKVD